MTRSYHHGNLRPALVATAVDLARASGPGGVVLREVARQTGVSHNAAYRHFSDREELLAEVASWSMGRLEQAMRDRLGTVRSRDPAVRARRRLQEVGRAYVEFALAEPGLFEVAFSTPFAAKSQGGEGGEGGPYALLNQVLDELVETSAMPADRRPGAEVACWAGVHGFSQLHLRGPLRGASPEEREQSLDRMLTLLDRALTQPA